MDYEIRHYGIGKQKWGHRRYQNPDGTYTEEGKAGTALVAGVTSAINTVNNLYNSGNNLVRNGKEMAKKLAKK